MIEFLIIVFIFWIPAFIIILRNILWDTYFWQLKEFRWDRFWTHIRWDYDEQNRNYLVTGAKFILFALTSLVFQVPILTVGAVIIAFGLWLFEMFTVIQTIIFKRQKRPSFKNPRNLLIISAPLLFMVICVVLLTLPFAVFVRDLGTLPYSELMSNLVITTNGFVYPDVYIYLAFATLVGLFFDLTTPLFTFIAVVFTAPIALARKYITILKAKSKFENVRSKIVVIGITGSQGKTTMKDILYALLKDSFKVAKTPENYNTDFGVAVSVLRQIKSDTEIFIAEMGAYRKGEIKAIASHFPPHYSIVTDVDVQHIGIFGSEQKLSEAKSELIKYMHFNGVAVLNGDNERCVQMLKFTEKAIVVYSEKESEKHLKHIDTSKILLIHAEQIKSTTSGISFTLKTERGEDIKIAVPQKGLHLINTYLMAFAVALDLGVSQKDLVKRLKDLTMNMPRLAIETGDNGTIILDDSYNSSYKGFIAAIKLMQEYFTKGKDKQRIVITKGIYELGKQKESIYKKLIDTIRPQIDVLITSDSLLAHIAKENNVSLQVIYVKGYEDMIYAVRKHMTPGDVILLEGRLHPEVIKEIVSDKR